MSFNTSATATPWRSAISGLIWPAIAQPLGEVGTELVRRIGQRSVLGRVPHAEVEEVDDADVDAARDAGLVPRAGVGQLHLVADDRPGTERLMMRHAVDRSRTLHVLDSTFGRQLLDSRRQARTPAPVVRRPSP